MDTIRAYIRTQLEPLKGSAEYDDKLKKVAELNGERGYKNVAACPADQLDELFTAIKRWI